MPMTMPPKTWPLAPMRLMIMPESCDGGDLQHAHDARLAVDLDAGGVGEDLRLEERLHAEAAEAALRVARRVLGHGPRALAEERRRRTPASSAISTAFAGEPTTCTLPPASSRSSRDTSSSSAARSSSCSRTSTAAATTARPLFMVVCEPDEPASQGPRRCPGRGSRSPSGAMPSTSATRSGSPITAPLPFSWAPVMIVPEPSALSFT